MPQVSQAKVDVYEVGKLWQWKVSKFKRLHILGPVIDHKLRRHSQRKPVTLVQRRHTPAVNGDRLACNVGGLLRSNKRTERAQFGRVAKSLHRSMSGIYFNRLVL